MDVKLSPQVIKYLSKCDPIIKRRIAKALHGLSQDPPQGDIKMLSGKDGFRLRIGKYRVLFDIGEDDIIVYEIGLRGQIYK